MNKRIRITTVDYEWWYGLLPNIHLDLRGADIDTHFSIDLSWLRWSISFEVYSTDKLKK